MLILTKNKQLFLHPIFLKLLALRSINIYTVSRQASLEENRMNNFFSAEDLELLNEELEIMEHSEIKKEEDDPEMDASKRRYLEIIKKHKEDK